MNILTAIILITVGVSIWAWQKPENIAKLIFNPYKIKRERQYARFLTSGFIHADWMHLLFNMLAMYSFSRNLNYFFHFINPQYSDIILIGMYLSGIVVSSISSYIKHKDNYYYNSLGASGGVSAVIFACILFDPWNTIYLFFIPIPGILFGLLYLGYSFYYSRNQSNDNIGHDAHFWGAIWGIVFTIIAEPKVIEVFAEQMQHPTF